MDDSNDSVQKQAATEQDRFNASLVESTAHVWEDVGKAYQAYKRGIKERRAFKPGRDELHEKGDAIAMFARLPSCDQATVEFRRKFAGYFPDEFWAWQLLSDAELYAGSVVMGSVPLSPARRPFWQAYRDVLHAAWACGFADEYVIRLLNVPTHAGDAEDYFKQQAPALQLTRTLEFQPTYSFQHDILTLVRSTWCAKMCEYCRQPFVADKPARRFCAERYASDPEMSCYKQHRREVKRDLWKARGKQYRAKRKTKRLRKAKRSRPRLRY